MPQLRPATAPDFLLSRPERSVRTQGVTGTFADPFDAADALRKGEHPMVVGALPFNLDNPSALTVPHSIIRERGPLEPPSYYRTGPGASLYAAISGFIPQPDEHRQNVAAAVNTMHRTHLEKVVLARAVDISFLEKVDPLTVAARLIGRSPHGNGFIADLTPAGGSYVGAHLVGSSPEVLISRKGTTISAFPLAGSIPRGDTPEEDQAARDALMHSEKDQQEHNYVVEALVKVLAPLCKPHSFQVSQEVIGTSEMWHLATSITGELSGPNYPSALDVALRVHPTPAICGTPTESAYALIEEAEPFERGFYAGAVGWCDNTGDGEYVVAIRCAQVSGDGMQARAWAGGGLVAQSDPDTEVAETTAKLRTILRALELD